MKILIFNLFWLAKIIYITIITNTFASFNINFVVVVVVIVVTFVIITTFMLTFMGSFIDFDIN